MKICMVGGQAKEFVVVVNVFLGAIAENER
jgi:hypothetical protein